MTFESDLRINRFGAVVPKSGNVNVELVHREEKTTKIYRINVSKSFLSMFRLYLGKSSLQILLFCQHFPDGIPADISGFQGMLPATPSDFEFAN
jgi:hypothetical protein